MGWQTFALLFFAASWLICAVAALALLVFDREDQPEQTGRWTIDP